MCVSLDDCVAGMEMQKQGEMLAEILNGFHSHGVLASRIGFYTRTKQLFADARPAPHRTLDDGPLVRTAFDGVFLEKVAEMPAALKFAWHDHP